MKGKFSFSKWGLVFYAILIIVIPHPSLRSEASIIPVNPALQTGAWVSHPTLTSGQTAWAAGDDCAGYFNSASHSFLFYDIHRSAWTEVVLPGPQSIHWLLAKGQVVFGFTDDILVAYSSLKSQADVIPYVGNLLRDGTAESQKAYGVSDMLAYLVTDQRMYVFDAELAAWQEYDYGLPADYNPNSANFVVKEDYLAMGLHRTPSENPPKNVVYSRHTHSFNQLEDGIYVSVLVLDHGFARWSIKAGSTSLVGYSAFSNTFDVLPVVNEGLLYEAHRDNGFWYGPETVYGACFYKSLAPYQVQETYYGYDTRLGKWSREQREYDATTATPTRCNFKQGGRFVLGFFKPSTTSDYRYRLYSGDTGEFSYNNTGLEEWGSVWAGGWVALTYNDDLAWGYGLGHPCGVLTDLPEGETKYRSLGEDYAVLGKRNSATQELRLFIFNGNAYAWRVFSFSGDPGTASSMTAGSPRVFMLQLGNPTKDAFFYSSALDQARTCQFSDVYIRNIGVSAALAYSTTDTKTCLFDALSGQLYEMDFRTNIYPSQYPLGDYAMCTADFEKHILHGYSTYTGHWTTQAIDGDLNVCKARGYTGLASVKSATQTQARYEAFNGLADEWVELIPSGTDRGSAVGERTAIVVRSDRVYVFDPDGLSGMKNIFLPLMKR